MARGRRSDSLRAVAMSRAAVDQAVYSWLCLSHTVWRRSAMSAQTRMRLLPVYGVGPDCRLMRSNRRSSVRRGLSDQGWVGACGDVWAIAACFLICTSGIVGEEAPSSKCETHVEAPWCRECRPEPICAHALSACRRVLSWSFRGASMCGATHPLGRNACIIGRLSRTLGLHRTLAGVAERYTRRSQKPLLSRG